MVLRKKKEGSSMITLAIPVYNMESLLTRCMDSMLAQTCRDFEILLIDDGSTDASGAMCDRYAAEHPDFIRVIHKPNGGLCSARNTGIREAAGEFIVFPDPDDWVEPDYVRHLLELQRSGDADLVCTGYYVDTDDTCVPGSGDGPQTVFTAEEARKSLLLPPCMSGFAWNKLYRLEIIRQNGLLFLDEAGIREDLDFAYRYLGFCWKAVYWPEARTYHYYQRPNAATHSGFSPKKLAMFRTYEKIMEDAQGWCPELAEAARDLMCANAVNMIWEWYRSDRKDRSSRVKLMGYLRQYLPNHLRSHHFRTGRKLQAVMALLWPAGYAWLRSTMRERNGEMIC